MIKMEDKNVIAGLERTYRTMNPAPSSKKDKDTFSPERLTWLFLGSVHFLFPKLHRYYKKYSRLEDAIAG